MKDDIQEPTQTPDTEVVDVEETEELQEQVAEVAAEDAPVLAAEENAVMSQLNLESLINRYMKDIETTQEKMKAHKSMLDDSYNNDAEYAQAAQKVKDATKVKKGIKEKIAKQEVVARLEEEVIGLKDELSDQREALSQYLQQYQAQTGMNQFTTESGDILEIVTVRRLVKRQSGK